MSNQKGGKYIARGSYGCVYRPNLECPEGSPENMNEISKIIEIRNLNEEWKPISEFNLDKIDPDNKYFIYPLEACRLTNEAINAEKEFFRCDLFKSRNRSHIIKNYINTIQPNGGTVSYMRKLDLNFEENWHLYINLLIGLGILHKNRIYHRDIKEDNIVYTPVDGFRLIDFGLTLGYESLPLVNNAKLDDDIKFHKQHIREAVRAIPQISRDVNRLTNEIRTNSSKSKVFRKPLTKIQEKIKKVKELRTILQGMKSKEQYHREQLSIILDYRYSGWSDSKESYMFWSKDFYILNKFLNEKEKLPIYDKDGSFKLGEYASFSGGLLDSAFNLYSQQILRIPKRTIEKMMISYQTFLENTFAKQIYNSDEQFYRITRKAIETFDIFSIGLFLGSEYRKCTDRKKQNQNYRNDFRLMNENLLTLNPEDRPTIDKVITDFMKIVKINLLDTNFLPKHKVKFENLIRDIEEHEICSREQIQEIRSS